MILIDCEYKEPDQKRISDLCEFILKYFDLFDKEISISFVSDEEIRSLNAAYRNIDASTDVLSFALNEGEDLFDDSMLGDIVISADTAKRQACELSHPLFAEIDNLIVHSMLHLLGYDHTEKEERIRMFDIHKKILKEFYEYTKESEYKYSDWLPEENE